LAIKQVNNNNIFPISTQLNFFFKFEDLEKARAVSPEEAEEWAVQQNMQFIEVSARAGQDEGEVNKLFQWAIDGNTTRTSFLLWTNPHVSFFSIADP
jgi:hypothetical protein